MQFVKGFFRPIGEAIQNLMNAFQPLRDAMSEIFGEGEGIGQVFEVIGSILSRFIVFIVANTFFQYI